LQTFLSVDFAVLNLDQLASKMTKLKRDVRVSISSVICTFVWLTYFRRCTFQIRSMKLLCVGQILYVFVNVYASDSLEKPSWEICRLRCWNRLWQLCIPFLEPCRSYSLYRFIRRLTLRWTTVFFTCIYNRSLRSNLNSKVLKEKLDRFSVLSACLVVWLAKLSLLWLVEVFFFPRWNYVHWSKNRFII